MGMGMGDVWIRVTFKRVKRVGSTGLTITGKTIAHRQKSTPN